MARIVITPIVPRKPVGKELKRLDKALRRYLEKEVGPLLKKDMESTTENWNRKPLFVQEYSEPFGTRKQVRIFPKGRNRLKWSRISTGTRRRVIRSKKQGRAMVFKRDYIPKTTPGGRYGGPGIKTGPQVITHRVFHSITPRNFSKTIKERREQQIEQGAIQLVRRIVK